MMPSQILSDRFKHTSEWVLKHSTRFTPTAEGKFSTSTSQEKIRLKNGLEETMPSMNRRVDVSHLTEEECSKILNVISKDILIRKSETERITYLTKKFEDIRRAVILTNSRRKKLLSFDDFCLICGKHLFTFCCFLQRGEECISCENSCCSDCRNVLVVTCGEKTNEHFLCKLCVQKRAVKSTTMQWYQELVEKRFKRCGSAKALRAIYKQRTTIEPRVITLLAMCRELQPLRKKSLSTIHKRYKVTYSKEDDKIDYSSSYSDLELEASQSIKKAKDRRRHLSESDAAKLYSDSNNKPKAIHRSQSVASEICKTNSSVKEIIDKGSENLASTGAVRKNPRIQRVQSYDFVNGNVVCRKESLLEGPAVLKFTIVEEHETERAVKNVVKFTEMDYFGLVSLTLALCFVMALVSCIGCVFENSEKRTESDQEEG